MAKISIHDWFLRKKKEKQAKKETNKKTKTERLNIPDNLWVKCPSCNSTIYSKELKDNLKVCSKCNYHFRISAGERIDLLLDTDSFKEFASSLTATDFLGFFDTKAYRNRIDEATLKSSLNEAIVVGEGLIENNPLSFGVMDFSFMGGSMGSVVGEKFTRMIENSIEHKIPAVVVTASGGARMQEGIMSLMQMAKTSAALGRLRENSLPYISVMTDPTTGGTSASFAMLGDVNMAEPDALIGFAGPRVIEQTIRQKLPPGFQRSEYVQEHGMIDVVCDRRQLRENLSKFLRWFDER